MLYPLVNRDFLSVPCFFNKEFFILIAVGGGSVVTFFAPKKLPKRCKGSALDPWGDLVTMGVAPRSFDR